MEETITEKINRLRRNIEIHSIIYYKYSTNIVSDTYFDELCKELVKMQEEHPEEAAACYKPDLFKDFTGETGMHLTSDPTRFPLAEWLIERHEPLV